MALSPGFRIGPYEITAAVGAGGMGEVYRARDPKLQRDVAIKILPDLFAADPDRLARFDREAQTLAALNHPNIAQIHGIEGNALVMEFVEGEDLAQRIARGAVPLDEALPIARQIADALEAAHERGIVHRDLKPANIKVRPDGTVKVLDFGLAKLSTPDSAPGSMATSPTFTSPAMMTHAGIIIGTAAYMSPEQARGKSVDRRADLWALGVVIYEMLTGHAAFDGDTITDVLAAVVTRDPDWTALPPQTPPGVRRLLERCLARDARRRLADAGEASYQLEEAMTPGADRQPLGSGRPVFSWWTAVLTFLPWTIVAVSITLVGLLAWKLTRVPAPEVLRYSVDPPAKTSLNLVGRPAIALSPDGTLLAFIGTSGGTTHVFLRKRTEFDAHVVPGTEGASEPVFSPDGRWLAFYANNKLNKVPVEGGPVEALADVNDPRGLSWDADDVITFSPQSTGGVFQISPSHGGEPRQVTKASEKVERTHRWPQMLPNGAVIFTVGSLTSPDNYDGASIEAQLPKTGERRVVMRGAAMARYLAPGTLLFARAGALYAVAFDAGKVEISGTPVAIMQGIAGDATTGSTDFACSAAGTFAYVATQGDGTLHRLMWVDRAGRTERVDLPPSMFFDLKLSPDGRRAAVIVVASGGGDVWVYDFARKTFTRLTFGGSHRTPVWSRDGKNVYYVALAANGSFNQIVRKTADGSGEEEPMATVPNGLFLRDVSPDQREALLDYNTNVRKTDIAKLAFDKDAKFVPITATAFDEYSAALSPDGRWVAYQSDETSVFQIYVREASGKGGRWQVSTGGGEEPHWSADGRELYFRADTQMMMVRVELGATFQFGPAQVLFDGLYNLRSESGVSFDVDPNGRFLMVRLADESAAPSSIRLIINWTSELKRLMTAGR
ncbi:MAG TPA: protein kinase [Vicinamibacterales bacterium]|nr:protein kinase [Vicinamibacterales bacterium]